MWHQQHEIKGRATGQLGTVTVKSVVCSLGQGVLVVGGEEW